MSGSKYENATDGTRLISDDIWLEPYADALRRRYSLYQKKKKEIEKYEGSLLEFSCGYRKFGFNRIFMDLENKSLDFKDCFSQSKQQRPNGILYREWCPGAKKMFLTGDFNNWNRESHPCSKDEYGVFSIFLPDKENGEPAIKHATKVKISIVTGNNEKVDRIPAWIRVVWQEHNNPYFDGVYWNPPVSYEWKHNSPRVPKDLRIYETHVGMSSIEPKVSTYIEFTRDVLPEIKEVGYNAVQIMGIMEHAYYASFGYQVTNFFGISSRFGTPEELKALIDRAHELGLVVFLDLVHSHASKNVTDGLNQFDGTDHMYFHEGGKGYHPIWDSRLFNYSHWEVLRFLLSNARWFIDEYHFDGYRFDGVTSMIYTHHGVCHAFERGYEEYFHQEWIDDDAIVYLSLANDMLHSLRTIRTNLNETGCLPPSEIITIAEEVSGMCGLCRPLEEGGIGFDYRLAMGIPDKWIELLSKVKDEDWNMGNLVWALINRRYKEATIAYAESHDQALVGDKTIAFWLMDKEMYFHMSVLQERNPIISRGIALHKMIRLLTCTLGGEGYLNFMGNEFGHPEWIDFPREGNNWSYHYARRRWDLAKDPLLRYKHIYAFDKAMNRLEEKHKWLSSPQAFVTLKHELDKIIAFERGGLLFVFNFHPEKSFSDYQLGVSLPGKYNIVLDSDNAEFDGFERISKYSDYFTQPISNHSWPQSLMIYIPSRTALVFRLET